MKAVGVIIFSPDQTQILLSKRSKNEEDEIGKWENVGGKLEQGESFEDAVIREVKEELGVLVTSMEERLLYGEEDSDFCIKVFEVQIEGTPQIMEPYYCDEIRWFSLGELKDIDLATYTLEDFKRLDWVNSN